MALECALQMMCLKVSPSQTGLFTVPTQREHKSRKKQIKEGRTGGKGGKKERWGAAHVLFFVYLDHCTETVIDKIIC